MPEIINNILFDFNSANLGKYLGRKAADTNYTAYACHLKQWNSSCPKKQKQAIELFRTSTEFVSSMVNPSVLDETSVVYTITYKNSILYVGSTKNSFNIRYFDIRKRNVILQDYLQKTNPKDLEIFIRRVPSQYIRKVESLYINAFCSFGLPLCNIKTENIPQFLWMYTQHLGARNITLKHFFDRVWLDVQTEDYEKYSRNPINN